MQACWRPLPPSPSADCRTLGPSCLHLGKTGVPVAGNPGAMLPRPEHWSGGGLLPTPISEPSVSFLAVTWPSP